MNFTFVPTLEHAALVKTAVILWNQDNIRNLLSIFNVQPSDLQSAQNEWQKVEDMVAEKVPELGLAASLGKKLRGIIEPVGVQILKWQKYHIREDLCLGLHLPTNFSWTVQGTINYKETAKKLIKDENLDIFERYKLACINCLEDDIRMLWNRSPQILRNDLCNAQLVNRNPIVTFWSDTLKREMWPHSAEGLTSVSVPSQFVFRYSALVSFNRMATKHFFLQLTPTQKSEYLNSIIIAVLCTVRDLIFDGSVSCIGECSNILFFLLSQVDREQQMEIMKPFVFEVLFCYLMWPMQSLFVEAADQLWDFLDEEKYLLILMAICNRVKGGLKDHNYKELLRNFWQHSPYRFVIHIINNCGKKEFSLSRLYKYDDRSVLKLFLKDIPHIQKRGMLETTELCENLIQRGDWLTIAVLVEECLPSKDLILKFKNEMEVRLIVLQRERKLEENIRGKFSQLLDTLIKNLDKRNEKLNVK